VHELDVDVAIIGGGTAGMAAYRMAQTHTERLVLIEADRWGTTCARVGCMPSKLLIAAADAAHAARGVGRFGLAAGAVEVDGRAVMERVRRERDRFVGFVLDAVESWPEARRLTGGARFLDDHHLMVGDYTRVRADRVVVATGSRTAVLDEWRALGDRLIVNDDVFDWRTLPASVAVFGGGVIGLELAQALHRLDVRVRLFGKGGAVGPLGDPRVLERAAAIFRGEYPFLPDADVESVTRDGDEVVVAFTDADGERKVERFDYLLAAIGRRPDVDGLDLDKTSLPLNEKGGLHFDPRTCRVGDSHVFVAGDATGEVPLLHVAADEGRVAGDNAGRFPDVRGRPRRAELAVVFSDPGIAIVGAGHRELEQLGVPFAVGEVDYGDQGRARVIGRNAGLLRVYGAPDTGKLIGAEMVAPAAEHLAHLLAWAIQADRTVQDVLDSPFYHPVLEEGLRTALRNLRHALAMGPPPIERCLDCGPGG
jgi:dihydrolipoamide dehydrogenase